MLSEGVSDQGATVSTKADLDFDFKMKRASSAGSWAASQKCFHESIASLFLLASVPVQVMHSD